MKSQVIANWAPLKVMTEDLRKNHGARAKVGVFNKGIRNPPSNAFLVRHSHAVSSGWLKKPYDLSPKTNAEVGLIHEFGSVSDHIPARSFLRVPLITQLPKKLQLIGQKVWSDLITQRGLLHALENLGLIGMQIVDMGFATGGYGKWAPNAPVTIYIKGSAHPLINSAQLRKSIGMVVVKGSP